MIALDSDHLGYALSHYASALLLVFLAYITGRRFLLKFEFHSGWENFAFSTCLGLGIIIYLVMLLGFTHLLYSWAVLILAMILIVFSYPVYRQWPSDVIKAFKSGNPFYIHLLLCIIGIIAFIWILKPVLEVPMYPPNRHDTTSFHLPLAKFFAGWHEIRITPYLEYPAIPMNIHMLFTLMLLVADEIAAMTAHMMCLGVLAAGLVGWGARIQSYRAGIWAGILILTTPHFFMIGGSGNVDMGIALFCTMAIYAFINWIYTRDDKWLWLSAVIFGFAAGTKYTPLVLAFIFGLVSLYFSIRDRNFRRTLIFSLVFLGIACPWYIRNIILTGNPVHPWAMDIFGYNLWNMADIERQMIEMKSHGTGQSLMSFIKMPWSVLNQPVTFVENDTLNITWLWLLPLGIIIGNFKSVTRWLLAVVLVFFLYWFFSVQVLRYLDPVLPLLGLVMMVSLDYLLNLIPGLKEKWPHIIVLILIVFALLIPGANYARQKFAPKAPFPITMEERLEFYSKKWGKPYRHMPIFLDLNERHGTDYSIYTMGNNQMQYFCDGLMMGDQFGPARFSNICYRAEDGDGFIFYDSETIYSVLHDQLNADYFLHDKAKFRVDLPEDEFFREHFIKIGEIPSQPLPFQNTTVSLFKIVE